MSTIPCNDSIVLKQDATLPLASYLCRPGDHAGDSRRPARDPTPPAPPDTQTPLIRFGTTHTGAQSTDCSRGVGISFRFISRREYSQLPVWVWYNVHSKFSLRVHSSHVSSTGFASFADVDPGVRVPFRVRPPTHMASPAQLAIIFLLLITNPKSPRPTTHPQRRYVRPPTHQV